MDTVLNKSKQWFELHGNVMKCKTEIDGFATECNAFMDGDMHHNIAMLNEMIARGKDEVEAYIVKHKTAVNLGGWKITPHSGGIGVVKYEPLSECVFPLTPARGSGKSVYVRRYLPPVIENVIFNAPATIVFWSDGTKTIVKATNELFDREKGLAMAIAKKFLGNKGNYFNTFRKYIE